MDILTILILPVYEHRIVLHLFVLSSITLVKFISSYLIYFFFDAIVNRIVFLISFSAIFYCIET